MTLIKSAITIIEFVLAPAHIMMIGPNATFGKEFNIVKKGSKTSARNLFKYMITLTIKAIIIPNVNDMKTSINVVPK